MYLSKPEANYAFLFFNFLRSRVACLCKKITGLHRVLPMHNYLSLSVRICSYVSLSVHICPYLSVSVRICLYLSLPV